MAAKKGNTDWTKRNRHGRKKKYTSIELWKKAVEYFEYIHSTPFIKIEYRGTPLKAVEIEKPRPFTLTGLYVFLNISRSTFNRYGEDSKYKNVIEDIKSVIWVNQFNGAAAGIFNANIIISKLGLRDKKRIEQSKEASIFDEKEKRFLDSPYIALKINSQSLRTRA